MELTCIFYTSCMYCMFAYCLHPYNMMINIVSYIPTRVASVGKQRCETGSEA